MEVLSSTKNKPILVEGSHLFYLSNKTETKTKGWRLYWRCQRDRICNASFVTNLEYEVQSRGQYPHTHEGDMAAVEKLRIINQIKNRAAETFESAEQIVSSIKADAPETLLNGLPTTESLYRNIQRQRRRERGPAYDGTKKRKALAEKDMPSSKCHRGSSSSQNVENQTPTEPASSSTTPPSTLNELLLSDITEFINDNIDQQAPMPIAPEEASTSNEILDLTKLLNDDHNNPAQQSMASTSVAPEEEASTLNDSTKFFTDNPPQQSLASTETSTLNDHNKPPQQYLPPPSAPKEVDEECQLFGRQVSMDLNNLNPRFRMIARYEVNKIMMQLFLKQTENSNGNHVL